MGTDRALEAEFVELSDIAGVRESIEALFADGCANLLAAVLLSDPASRSDEKPLNASLSSIAIATGRTELREQERFASRAKRDYPSWWTLPGVSPSVEEPEDPISLALPILVLDAATRYHSIDLPHSLKVRLLSTLAEETRFAPGQLQDLDGKGDGVLPVPLLQASFALRALQTSAPHAVSYGAWVCAYVLIQEVFTVGPPDFQVGSVRASRHGADTAFMCEQAALALNGFAQVFKQSARSCEVLADILEDVSVQVQHLNNLFVHESYAKAEWDRLTTSYVTDLRRSARGSCMVLDGVVAQLGNAAMNLSTIQGAIRGAATLAVVECFDRLSAGLVKALNDVRVRTDAIGGRPGSRQGPTQPTGTHQNNQADPDGEGPKVEGEGQRSAIRLLEFLKDACSGSRDAFKGADGISVPEFETLLRGTAGELRKCERKMRLQLDPIVTYAERVLDLHLTGARTSGSNEWSAFELACAASALIELTRSPHGTRLDLARDTLVAQLSPKGQLPNPPSIGVSGDGFSLNVSPCEGTRACMSVLGHSARHIDLEVCKRVHERLRADMVFETPGGRSVGWTQPIRVVPRRASRWATAVNLLAASEVIRSLSSVLNQRILPHFTVTLPERSGDQGRRLRTESYPDAGTGWACEGLGQKYLSNAYSGSVLEKMRRHVLGLTLLSDGPALFSVVLAGPPGTGKTTLLEILAEDAAVPLVQLSPGDFVLEGVAVIERRARAVMGALAMLSGCVIILDEFEPIVRRRGGAREGQVGDERFLTTGMLPKLTTLYKSAKRRMLSYALLTNRFDELEWAAVRDRRFDVRLRFDFTDSLTRMSFAARGLALGSGAECTHSDVVKVARAMSHCDGTRPRECLDLAVTLGRRLGALAVMPRAESRAKGSIRQMSGSELGRAEIAEIERLREVDRLLYSGLVAAPRITAKDGEWSIERVAKEAIKSMGGAKGRLSKSKKRKSVHPKKGTGRRSGRGK